MQVINNIIEWLKENGNTEDGSAYTYSIHEEPWMDFQAEWQDWSFDKPGSGILYLGYFYCQNGDLCPDPQLVVHLRENEVYRVDFTNFIDVYFDSTDDDYSMGFAELVWQRHMMNRVPVLA